MTTGKTLDGNTDAENAPLMGRLTVPRRCTLLFGGYVRLLVVSAIGLAGIQGWTSTGYWTGGGETGAWTDKANWKDGVIPGRLGDPTADADTATGEFGDTAVFAAVPDGAQTTIDLSGLRSIGHIVIRGADAPVFTFGSAAGGTKAVAKHNLRIEPDASFTVESDVVNAPRFFEGIRIADGFDVGDASGVSVITNVFRNESSVVLDLPAFAEVAGIAESPFITKPVIDFRGSGDIRLNGEFYNNFEKIILNQTGELIVNTILRSRESGLYAPYGIESGADVSVSRIRINEGCELTPRLQYQNYISAADSDLEISGEGVFGVHFSGNNTILTVAQGRTLDIGCRMVSYVKESGVLAYGGGLHPVKGEGTLRLSHSANGIRGQFQIATACTVETPSIGEPNVESSIGSGSVAFGNWGTVKYTGTGETTGKSVMLTNLYDYINSHGTLLQAGTGLWKLTNLAYAGAKDAILQLDGAADAADAEISSSLSDSPSGKVLSVIKKGTGRWILSGVNTYTGMTTLEGGALRYAASQTVASLTVDGNATLEVADGVTVTVSAFSHQSGSLDVLTLGEAATVKIPALTGQKPAYLTWNGSAARVDADGTVMVDADATIAARGDVIPDNGGSVAIVRAGDGGNDTLASDTVTLTRLEQVCPTPATIEIGEGRTLSASEVLLGACGGDLSIGVPGDKGKLDANGPLVLRNNSATAGLAVNADIGANVSRTVVRGVGETVFTGKKTLSRELLVQDEDVGAPATLALVDAQVSLGEEPLFVGYHNTGNDYQSLLSKVGRMVVTNSSLINATIGESYLTSSNRCLGIGRNATGTLIVEAGSVISNKIQVGVVTDNYTGKGRGALYLRGGEIAILGQNVNLQQSSGIGMGSGHGYMEMTGGALTALGEFAIGGYGTGVWSQRGCVTSRFERAVGAASPSSLYVQGFNGFAGLVHLSDGAQMIHREGNLWIGNSYNSAAHTHIVVEGDGTVFDNGGSFAYFNEQVDLASRAYVDILHGGTFVAHGFTQRKANPSCFISFDGGTFRCAANGAAIFCGAQPGHAVDRVTVYSGGMTVDTAGLEVSTGAPISGATGHGVVGFDGAFPICAGSNVAPYVEIDGDGEGAAAVAMYDSERQCVTNLAVTAPGVGYTVATAKVYLASIAVTEIPCVLAPNSNVGAFIKTGGGTLSLTAANTWGGDTVLAEGVLRLDAADALPRGTTVVFAGGVLDANGYAMPASYAVDCATVTANGAVTYPAAFDFPGGSTLAPKNVDALANISKPVTLLRFADGFKGMPSLVSDELPAGWTLRLSGNRLRIGPEKGTLVILR
ncbi:MAG: autotransporter-associated beta strand repeat-containing protein [Verrucomicrobiota bacterium]|nr:autotransporter-associated beta strand repeat-containing protein [Verrucomicrobiota bacterium]